MNLSGPFCITLYLFVCLWLHKESLSRNALYPAMSLNFTKIYVKRVYHHAHTFISNKYCNKVCIKYVQVRTKNTISTSKTLFMVENIINDRGCGNIVWFVSDMKSRYDALAQSASEKVAKIEEVLESRKQLETDQGKVNKWSTETEKQIDHDVDLGMYYRISGQFVNHRNLGNVRWKESQEPDIYSCYKSISFWAHLC